MFQFRRFPTYTYLIQYRLVQVYCTGFPHSEISGSKLICSSPKLIAAYHVLLRLLMPRHSPCALISLTFSSLSTTYKHCRKSISGFSQSFIRRIMQAPFKEVSLAKIVFTLKNLFPLLLPSHNISSSFYVQFSRYISRALVTRWWAKVDSNHRPHDYQSCALAS